MCHSLYLHHQSGREAAYRHWGRVLRGRGPPAEAGGAGRRRCRCSGAMIPVITPEHLLDPIAPFEDPPLRVCLLWDLHDPPDPADEDLTTLAAWMAAGEGLN